MKHSLTHRHSRSVKLSAVVLTILCLIIIPGSLAQGNENQGVTLRVEGIEANIFSGTIELPAGGETVTALTVLKEALNGDGIEFEIKEADFGSYVASINNENEATFGGFDGWIFAVNGELAATGAADYEVRENDEILFYYGLFPPDTLIPSVEISPAQPKVDESIQITVTASYYDWTENKDITVAVENAAVAFEESVYLTDAKGQATIPAVQEAGTYSFYVDKDSEGVLPVIARTGAIDFKVEEEEEEQPGKFLSSPLARLVILALFILTLYLLKNKKAKTN